MRDFEIPPAAAAIDNDDGGGTTAELKPSGEKQTKKGLNLSGLSFSR